MNKRGQLTIFILVGIVIVVVIFGIFFISSNASKKRLDAQYFGTGDLQKQVENLEFSIQECIDQASTDSLIIIAFQGGYVDAPQRKFDYSPFFFPYYYYEGEINLPSLETIEFELGKSISARFLDCLRSEEENHNLRLRYSDTLLTTKITNQNVYVEIDMPLTIESEGHSMILELSDFASNYNSSLYEIYEVAEFITESHREDPEYYCISCVAEMAQERDLYVYMFPNVANEDITGVMIYENRTQIADLYGYIFFNKYTGNEKTPKLNS